MRTLVDLRYGPGTWQSIIDERARRIQQAKAAAAKARKEALRQRAEFIENVKIAVTIGVIALIGFGFIMFAMVSMAAVVGI